jgi:hypothetical protein
MNTFKYKPSTRVAFALTAFFLGELGDGLNIFQVIANLVSLVFERCIMSWFTAHRLPLYHRGYIL